MGLIVFGTPMLGPGYLTGRPGGAIDELDNDQSLVYNTICSVVSPEITRRDGHVKCLFLVR